MDRKVSLLGALVLVGALVTQGSAAEQQSASLPSSGNYLVTAVIAPGGAAAEVFGRDSTDQPEKFGIDIDGSGNLTVNGQNAGTVDPYGTYEITVDVTISSSVTYVTRVRDSQSNLLCETTHSTADAPTVAEAEADDVVSLSVQ